MSGRRRGVHRRLGQIYMVAVLGSALAAFYLATHTELLVFGSGIFGLGVAWLITTALAYVAVRRNKIEQHKEWMIRSYVVTFGFVTFRVLNRVLQATDWPSAAQSPMIGAFPVQAGVSAWFCWAVPLLVTEAFLQGRKIFA